MKYTGKSFAFYLSLATGLVLMFIGGRFLVAPAIAEADFGINIDTHGDFSFHYIKGVRDFFSGLAIILLLFAKEFRALGILLLCSVIIPATDFVVIVTQADYEGNKLYPHLIAVVIVVTLGACYLWPIRKRGKETAVSGRYKNQ